MHGVEELSAGDRTRVGEVEVRAVPAEHDDRRLPLGDARAEPIGFVVDAGLRVYFAGDTSLFDGMSAVGPVDLALLPVAGWGPTMGPGHMDAADAARAAAMVGARVAVPIHWGTFAPLTTRAGDWFSEPPREFAAQVAELAPGVEVRILSPGESTEVA
jgi:L-ascorbate metabolism protein UlaG (beta-lactamase superfamily)